MPGGESEWSVAMGSRRKWADSWVVHGCMEVAAGWYWSYLVDRERKLKVFHEG